MSGLHLKAGNDGKAVEMTEITINTGSVPEPAPELRKQVSSYFGRADGEPDTIMAKTQNRGKFWKRNMDALRVKMHQKVVASKKGSQDKAMIEHVEVRNVPAWLF